MNSKNKTGQLPAIRIEPDLFAKIEAEAEANFESVAEIVRRRIALAYEDPDRVIVKTAAQELRERKETLEIEKLERAAAKERKELLTVDEAFGVVVKDYAQIRQSLLSFAASAALDLALSDDARDRLAAMTQDLMTGLSGEQRETFDDIAKQS